MIYPPPPGYVRSKPRKVKDKGLTVGEVFRTTAKLADGYNKAASLQALADIAQSVRRLFRG